VTGPNRSGCISSGKLAMGFSPEKTCISLGGASNTAGGVTEIVGGGATTCCAPADAAKPNKPASVT